VLQSGSFTTTGTIIAQTINVQTVTSSIVYSSGSNIFGNLLGDSQTFTGSVLVTGSLTIAGASSATSYSGATIYGSTAVCSPVGKFTTCIDVGSGTFSGAITATQSTNGEQALSVINTNNGTSAAAVFNLQNDTNSSQIVYTSSTYTGVYGCGANAINIINRNSGPINILTAGY
jgi:hypothetical protein